MLFSKGWLNTRVLCQFCLCHCIVMCVTEVVSWTCEGCNGIEIPWVLHDTTFVLGMIYLICWRRERAGGITLMWWCGGISYMKIWEALLLTGLNKHSSKCNKVNFCLWLSQNCLFQVQICKRLLLICRLIWFISVARGYKMNFVRNRDMTLNVFIHF